eukprot:TRINITY_DN59157_c0_g1_i1.p2 TRINITY_DN59157_c0_g1~~TRINITY_DN59157_c0_g1_i1.p2  ORF type:complete len:681 (-),score=42.96 TRINITY_DN59157_c0_g1_i1:2760-4802(-)
MSSHPAPPQPIGTVRVKVRRASNIKDVDKMNKSDPYVVLQIGSEKQQTRVIKNDLNPEWNEEKTFRVPLRQSSHHRHWLPRDYIVVTMFDNTMMGKPRPLGKGVIQLRDYRYGEVRQEQLAMEEGVLYLDVTAIDWGMGGPSPGGGGPMGGEMYPSGMKPHRSHKHHRHSSPPVARPPLPYGSGHMSPQRHSPFGGPQYSYLGPHTALGTIPTSPIHGRPGGPPPGNTFPPGPGGPGFPPTIPIPGVTQSPPGSPPPPGSQVFPSATAFPAPYQHTVPIPAVAPQSQPTHPYHPQQQNPWSPPPPQSPPSVVPTYPGPGGGELPPPPPTFTMPMGAMGPSNPNFAPVLSATPQNTSTLSPPRPVSPGHFHPPSQRPPTPPRGPPTPPRGMMMPMPGAPIQPQPPAVPSIDLRSHSPHHSMRSRSRSPSPSPRTTEMMQLVAPEDELQALKIQHMELANATRETRLQIERKEAEINMEKEAQRLAEKDRLFQERIMLENRLKELTEKERILQAQHAPPRLQPPSPQNSKMMQFNAQSALYANAALQQLAAENIHLERENEQERRRLDHLAATLAEQERRLDQLDRELHTPPRPQQMSPNGSPPYQTTTTVETYSRYGGNNSGGQVPRSHGTPQNTTSPKSHHSSSSHSHRGGGHSPQYGQYTSPPRLVETEHYNSYSSKHT